MDDLCTGCLCTGRNLFFIGDTDYYHLYEQLLNETSEHGTSAVCTRMCWECRASLRRLARFRTQVRCSHAWLMNHEPKDLSALPNPTLYTYPRLQIHHLPTTTYPYPIKAETEEDCYSQVECKSEIEEHCEPETFVNGLNVELLKERDQENVKTNKVKSKKKIKNRKKTKIKKKVKKKVKISIESDNDIKLSSDVDNDDINETEDTVISKSKECNMRLEAKEECSDQSKPDHKPNSIVDEALPALTSKPQLPERPECVECGKTFSSRKTYRYHLNVLHRGQNRYECPQCGKVYQWKSNLGRHVRSHKARDAGELYCALCDKRFASVATFRQHLRVSRRHVAETDFSFTCNECGKKFVNKTRLRDHIDWEHLKKIKFKCQLCDKPFKCHTSLYVHMQNVHRNKEKKDNLCHVCGKSYQNAAKLKYHIVAMHTSETPYRCRECGAAFGWYSSLYRHLREVHYKMKLQPKKTKKSKKLVNEPPSALTQQLMIPLHHV